MITVFHIFGNLAEDSENVKSLASDGAMLLAVALSTKADIPYEPLALVVSRPLMRCRTSLGVIVASSYGDWLL